MKKQFYFNLLILLILFFEIKSNDDEFSWSTAMGNARNTRRLIPSISNEYQGKSWSFLFNSSSQDTTIFGTGVGINGDLYLFLTDSRYSSADYMFCLTSNGEIRWKMNLESSPRMINMGVSNIVSDQKANLLYYTSTWADTGSFLSKICRVFYPQTHHPAQECVNTYKISTNYLAPLALNIKANLLITTVIDNVPAAFNTTTFEMIWNDQETMGSDPNVDYKIDPLTGDIYWIGGDDNMSKINSNGTRLFSNDTNSGGNRQFALDNQQQIVVRAWQNMSDHDWPLIVSAWNIDKTRGLHEQWQWKNDESNKDNTDCTPPVIDNINNLVYFVNLPNANALNINTGSIHWQIEIVSKTEMNQFDLLSECISLNEEKRIVYVLIKSRKLSFKLFLIAINVDTGKILQRIDLFQIDQKLTIPFCPILIGNDMIYISWLQGDYPNLVPLTIHAIPQLS